MLQWIGYPSQICLATTDHIRNCLRFMFLRIVIWGNRLTETYFNWSNSCRPNVQYSHIRQRCRICMFTQLDGASQLCGHVNLTGQFSACNHCSIQICLHSVKFLKQKVNWFVSKNPTYSNKLNKRNYWCHDHRHFQDIWSNTSVADEYPTQ